MPACKTCTSDTKATYCSGCGRPLSVKRITLASIVHEVAHFFTHLDKGFPYTLRKLLTTPGKMQKEYILADRHRHQKPFSMFFVSLTITALIFYWLNMAVFRYFQAGDENEIAFFHQYMVWFQIVMLPVYALITFLIFFDQAYNFAEIIVLQLYTFSFLMLLVGMIQLLKLVWPELQTRYIELPVITIYVIITNINFFDYSSKTKLFLKSVLVTVLCFSIASFAQDWLVEIIT